LASPKEPRRDPKRPTTRAGNCKGDAYIYEHDYVNSVESMWRHQNNWKQFVEMVACNRQWDNWTLNDKRKRFAI
jgi:hypothetical protein